MLWTTTSNLIRSLLVRNVPYELEVRMTEPFRDVLLLAGKIGVGHDYLVAPLHEIIHEMRANETAATGNQDPGATADLLALDIEDLDRRHRGGGRYHDFMLAPLENSDDCLRGISLFTTFS